MADYIGTTNSIIIPDSFIEAPQVIQETYRLWGKFVHTVTAEDVSQALHAAQRLNPADAHRLSHAAAATVGERFGSSVFENALSRVIDAIG
jgi:hypothetical protein